MSRVKTPVQTPGEQPTTTLTPTDTADGSAPEAGQPTGDAFQAQGSVLGGDASTTPPADPGSASMEQLRAMVEAQNQQIAALIGTVQGLQRAQVSPAAQVAQASVLPKLEDVDLAAINAGSTPVLTQQGWVVPPTHGTDPSHLEKLRAEAEQRKLNAALTKKLLGD